jgi:hypothetical protein
VTTEAGRKNQSALNDIASSTVSVVASQQAAGASNDVLVAKMGEGRAAFVAAAIAAGKTAEQANALADEYHLIPGDVSTAFHTSGADAAVLEAQKVQAAMDAINKNIAIHIKAIFDRSSLPDLNGAVSGSGRMGTSANGNLYAGGVAQAFANGGFPPGIYSGGAPLYKFAEPETRWEAYISGKPGMESRNRQIWVDAGRRLGTIGGSNSAGQSGPTVVSLAGATFQATIDGRPITMMIGEQIAQSNAGHATGLSTGYQRGTFG